MPLKLIFGWIKPLQPENSINGRGSGRARVCHICDKDFSHVPQLYCIQIRVAAWLCYQEMKIDLWVKTYAISFRSAKMMPSSPLLGGHHSASRSGTNSPKMDYDVKKDLVIGELASRIGRPIPEFNKNKRGKSQTKQKSRSDLQIC